jgi:hypothetical protein
MTKCTTKTTKTFELPNGFEVEFQTEQAGPYAPVVVRFLLTTNSETVRMTREAAVQMAELILAEWAPNKLITPLQDKD